MHRAPEEQIGFLLKRVMHAFRHALEAKLRDTASLSFAHFVTLDQINEEPGIVGAQLARRLLVTAQTMTDLLKRLEREGCIERRADPNNRRADRWYVCETGLDRLRSSRSAGGPVMTQMLSLLERDEVAKLRDFLERCVEGLEGEGKRDAGARDSAGPVTARKAPARARTARRTGTRRRGGTAAGASRRH
jgi:DNA-binding MarR family transcriptional regulator